jgi:hypothetical protein
MAPLLKPANRSFDFVGKASEIHQSEDFPVKPLPAGTFLLLNPTVVLSNAGVNQGFSQMFWPEVCSPGQ